MGILRIQLKLFLGLFFIVYFCGLIKAQESPAWLTNSWRIEQYPSNVFITGFAQDNKNAEESIADAIGRVTAMARGNLSEKIISSIQSVNDSYSQSISDGKSEQIKETFQSEIRVSTDIEINGVHIENYVKDNIVYGFAYANKYEIIGYYKSIINMTIQQIEGYIKTAQALEQQREKIKAKEEFNKTFPFFDKIKEAQGILTALDNTIPDEQLKMQKSIELYNEVVQANVRLQQAVLVFLSSNENLFGTQTTAIENGLKAILSENECSFTENENIADWKIYIKASAREFNYSKNVYFSYVDAEVQLFKAPKGKHVYQEILEQKGAHSKSYPDAARNAYNEISNLIADKVLERINQ